MRLVISTLAVMAMTVPFAASAQDRTGYAQISAGDFAKAEQTLVAERRIFPGRPELMLNLAAVYQKTDRVDAARGLYLDVLSRPNVLMTVSSARSLWSHDIARAALQRNAAVKVSAR